MVWAVAAVSAIGVGVSAYSSYQQASAMGDAAAAANGGANFSLPSIVSPGGGFAGYGSITTGQLGESTNAPSFSDMANFAGNGAPAPGVGYQASPQGGYGYPSANQFAPGGQGQVSQYSSPQQSPQTAFQQPAVEGPNFATGLGNEIKGGWKQQFNTPDGERPTEADFGDAPVRQQTTGRGLAGMVEQANFDSEFEKASAIYNTELETAQHEWDVSAAPTRYYVGKTGKDGTLSTGIVGDIGQSGGREINTGQHIGERANTAAGTTPFFDHDKTLQIGLGDKEAARSGLAALGTQQIGRAGMGGGTPAQVQAALNNASAQNTQAFTTEGQAGLDTLSGVAGQTLGQTQNQFQDRLTQGFNQGLQTQAFDAAGRSLADADVTQQQSREQALGNFRAQAQPENERAVNRQLNNLFSGGRLGTTGGANQVGRLAEAQNQQDLQFQQAANQEGRASQQQAINAAGQFTNLGSQQAGLGESLLNGAFNRFGQTQQVAGQVNNTRFQRSLAGQEFMQQGANQELQNQNVNQVQNRQLQNADLQIGTNALGAEGALQQGGLNQLNAALAIGSAENNAQLGAGSNVAAIAQNPNYGASPLDGLGGALVNNASQIGGSIAGAFSQPTAPIQTNFAPAIAQGAVPNVQAADGLKYYGAQI